jgi:hypothetical protein
MALSEFNAMETAYRALQQLDPTARRRAVRWLTDALGVPDPLPEEQTATAGGSDGAAEATGARAPGRRAAGGRRAAAASRSARTGRGRRAAAESAGDGQERPYRRMPAADEVLAAYRQVGTVSGLAEHFGVPRHTVQGWARRLRREGHDIGRTA